MGRKRKIWRLQGLLLMIRVLLGLFFVILACCVVDSVNITYIVALGGIGVSFLFWALPTVAQLDKRDL